MEQELGATLHKRKQGFNNQKKPLKEPDATASGEWEQGCPAA